MKYFYLQRKTLVVHIFFIFPSAFLLFGCAKSVSTKDEESNIQRREIGETRKERSGDHKIVINYPSFRNLNQAVNASRYVVKGLPKRVVCLSNKNNTYSNNLCENNGNNKSYGNMVNVLAVEVQFIELLYEDKNNIIKDPVGPPIKIEPVNWENETFLVPFQTDLTANSQVTKKKIANKYIGKQFYFLCSGRAYYGGDDGEKYKCGFSAQPPIRPIPESDAVELLEAINDIQMGVKSDTNHCYFKVYRKPDEQESSIYCPSSK